jgi:hypothetical protein
MTSSDFQYSRPYQQWGRWVTLGLIFLAYALYVYQLDAQSLWRDEALSVVRAQQPLAMQFANRNIVDGMEVPDVHPPLYFLILHGWRLLAGESEFALRYPSMMVMVLALAMFHAVGRRIWGRESAIWTVSLAVISPFFLWYAQEARMYTLVVLESLILFFALWPLMTGAARRINYLAFSVSCIILVFTHYSGIFLVAFTIFALLITQLRGRFQWRLLFIPVAFGIFASFLIYPHLGELLNLPDFLFFGQRPYWNLAEETINTFSLGSTVPMENPGWRLWPFVALGLLGALSLNISSPALRWKAAMIGIGGVAVTMFFFHAASWLQANYHNPRHLTVISVPWFLLMGHGLSTLRRHWQMLAILVGLGSLVSGSLAVIQTVNNPPIVKDDLRQLANYVQDRMRPGDLMLWHDAVMMVTYDYYAPDLPYQALPRYGQNWGSQEKVLQGLSEAAPDYNRIWFVDLPAPFYFDGTVIRGWLEEHMVHTDVAMFPAAWADLRLNLYQWPRFTDSLPDEAIRVDLSDNSYHVEGVVIEETAVVIEGVWITLLWSVAELADSPPSICLRLRDSVSVVWTQGCAFLAVPHDQESDRGLLSQQIWLPLPVGLAPVPHVMELALGDAEQSIGVFNIERPEGLPTSRPLAEFDIGIDLLDVEWASDVFLSGLSATGNLFWRIDSPIEDDLKVAVRLVDWLGRNVAEETFELGSADYPSEDWQAGDILRSAIVIRLPPDVAGRFRVQISITEADGSPLSSKGLFSGSWANIGWIRLERVPDLVDDVTLGDFVDLLGYDVSREDNELKVTLYWSATKNIEADYGVFVHVGQPGVPPIAQSSGRPADWTRPTVTWHEGEIVVDEHVIQLPVDPSTQTYSILVGLYDIEDPNIRVPIVTAREVVFGNAWLLGALSDINPVGP